MRGNRLDEGNGLCLDPSKNVYILFIIEFLFLMNLLNKDLSREKVKLK